MDDQTSAFLIALWRGGEFGYYWSSTGKKTQWMPVSTPAKCALGSGNVYMGVHPTVKAGTPHERGRIADVAAINCLFSEFDGKDFEGGLPSIRVHIKAFPVQPQVIVYSGGGYHAYWLIKEPVVVTDAIRDYLRGIQAAWVQLTSGDRGAHDLARVLRLPGTRNAKYVPPRQVTFARFDLSPEKRHDFCDLCALAEPLYDAPETITELPGGGVATVSTSAGAVAGIVGKLGEATEGERNNVLLWCACRLYERGLSEAGVTAELMATAERIGLRRSEVVATIRSASRQPIRNPTHNAGSQAHQTSLDPLADRRMTIASAINGGTGGK